MGKKQQQLKPCPFCGGNAAVMYGTPDDGTTTVTVVCQKCHIGIFRAKSLEWDAFKLADKNEAAAVWNARAKTEEAGV